MLIEVVKMRRRYNHRRGNKQRKIIICSFAILICLMTAGYAAFNTRLNVHVKGNVLDKSRIIKSWTNTSNEDFHTDFYRENTVSATFLDTNTVPNDAKEWWDVSANNKKGVMAWVVESSTETGKYDLFIGANKGVIANEDSSFLFQKFSELKSIEFNNNFDTGNTTSMRAMFHLCSNLHSLDVSSFNTTNVYSMNQMFNGCTNLTNIVGLENFNTGHVTDMYAMFHYCSNMLELDLESFNTQNVSNMNHLFAGCKKLEYLNLSNFDTSHVVDMESMFVNCPNLKSININNFNTDNVVNMKFMFNGCSNLEIINLCSFNTSKVTAMDAMFTGTKKLQNIYVGEGWTTATATTANMFLESNISSVTTGHCSTQ